MNKLLLAISEFTKKVSKHSDGDNVTELQAELTKLLDIAPELAVTTGIRVSKSTFAYYGHVASRLDLMVANYTLINSFNYSGVEHFTLDRVTKCDLDDASNVDGKVLVDTWPSKSIPVDPASDRTRFNHKTILGWTIISSVSNNAIMDIRRHVNGEVKDLTLLAEYQLPLNEDTIKKLTSIISKHWHNSKLVALMVTEMAAEHKKQMCEKNGY